jgi:hypothetical protein
MHSYIGLYINSPEAIIYSGALMSTLLHPTACLRNLLIVLVQITNKMGLWKKITLMMESVWTWDINSTSTQPTSSNDFSAQYKPTSKSPRLYD